MVTLSTWTCRMCPTSLAFALPFARAAAFGVGFAFGGGVDGSELGAARPLSTPPASGSGKRPVTRTS